jgi:putative tryptophan/tyrosine transport system substrate-binding protein
VTRPGGNITGFANYEVSIGAKWLELLKQIAPHGTRVAYHYDPANPAAVGYLHAIEATAPSMNVDVSATAARTTEDLERSIKALSVEPNGGLIVAPGPLMTAYRSLIRELSERYRLPAVYAFRDDVQSGALASYGIDAPELFRRAASYVDRILKGEKPGDLPIQYANKFHLAINLKTAKALGLDVPVSLLARTDEIIE